MNSESEGLLHDFEPGLEQIAGDVLRGLSDTPKQIPCKYFYDERGSQLFERICEAEEYYVPNTEMAIMEANIGQLVSVLGLDIVLIEYGSGSSLKTRFLLGHLEELAAYVPVDISREHLLKAAEGLRAEYPGLNVLPVCADYTGDFELPTLGQNCRCVVYFPGSTIGNFSPEKALSFLEHIADVVGPGGGLLIGVDLKKDHGVLNHAYNDGDGVTGAFNLNLLERLNRELGADFDLDGFAHHAFYNDAEGRVEMHLVSLKEQQVHLNGTVISFGQGESIWTESSYKYSLEEFGQLTARAGFEPRGVWMDENGWFSIQYLANTSAR